MIARRPNLEVAAKRFFHHQVSLGQFHIRVVSVPCGAWKCIPKTNSSGVDISEVTGCHLL